MKTASPAGFKTVNPGPLDVTEYILFYTKNKPDFRFKKGYVPVGYNKNYNLVLSRDGRGEGLDFPAHQGGCHGGSGFSSEKEAKSRYGTAWKAILEHLIADYAFDTPGMWSASGIRINLRRR